MALLGYVGVRKRVGSRKPSTTSTSLSMSRANLMDVEHQIWSVLPDERPGVSFTKSRTVSCSADVRTSKKHWHKLKAPDMSHARLRSLIREASNQKHGRFLSRIKTNKPVWQPVRPTFPGSCTDCAKMEYPKTTSAMWLRLRGKPIDTQVRMRLSRTA